jgi:hypothetical protein
LATSWHGGIEGHERQCDLHCRTGDWLNAGKRFTAKVTGGNVTNSGTITNQAVTGAADLTIDADTNNITLNNASNKLDTVSLTGTTVAATSISGLDVGATRANSLTATVSGAAVTNSGAIANQAGTGAADVTVTATGKDVTLGNTGNKLDNVSVGGANVSVYDSDTSGVVLGTVTATGTLGVTAKGHITQDGILTVTNAATFTIEDTASQNIDASTKANDFGSTVTFAKSGTGSVNNVGLRNANVGATFANITLPATYNDLTVIFDKAAMVLPALTVAGNLTISASGAIGQVGALDVTGTSSFTAYDASGPTRYLITLNDNANKFVGAVSAKGGVFTLDNGPTPPSSGRLT